jgi:hypothetical protein
MTAKTLACIRSAARATFLSIALGSAVAQAQPALFPETEVAPDQANALRLGVGADLQYHSNLFALPTNARSDMLLRVPLSVLFDRDFGRQQLRLEAQVTPTKYFDNSRLDFVGYSAGGRWDVELARPFYTQLEARFDRFRTPFSSSFTDNLEDRMLLRALGGFRFTPSWSVFSAIDQSTLDNSAALQRPNDFTFRGYEGGLRYEPGNATDVDFFYRRSDGEYPNRQVLDVNGNVLPGGIDNAFTQDAVLGRLVYRPSTDTRITGTAGYTRRDYSTLSQRNFSGFTIGGIVEWAWTGSVIMRVNILRDIVADTSLNANFAEIQRIALEPSIRMTGRTTLIPLAVWERRLYAGDPGFVISGAPERRDTLTRLGLEVRYEFARNVFLNGFGWSQRRSSNYSVFEFDDTVLGAGVRAYF